MKARTKGNAGDIHLIFIDYILIAILGCLSN